MFPSADTALTHILVVRDPGRSRSWYTDVLGATVYREYGASVVLSFAGAWLLLVEGGGPTDDKPTVTLAPPADPDLRDNLFTIRVDDCQATYELLRAGAFLERLAAKGRDTEFLRELPVHVITNTEVGLIGAALTALESL